MLVIVMLLRWPWASRLDDRQCRRREYGCRWQDRVIEGARMPAAMLRRAVDVTARAHPIRMEGHRAIRGHTRLKAGAGALAAERPVLWAYVEAVAVVELSIADVRRVVKAPRPGVVVEAHGATAHIGCLVNDVVAVDCGRRDRPERVDRATIANVDTTANQQAQHQYNRLGLVQPWVQHELGAR